MWNRKGIQLDCRRKQFLSKIIKIILCNGVFGINFRKEIYDELEEKFKLVELLLSSEG